MYLLDTDGELNNFKKNQVKLKIVLNQLIEQHLNLIMVLDKIIFKPVAKGYRSFALTSKNWNK